MVGFTSGAYEPALGRAIVMNVCEKYGRSSRFQVLITLHFCGGFPDVWTVTYRSGAAAPVGAGTCPEARPAQARHPSTGPTKRDRIISSLSFCACPCDRDNLPVESDDCIGFREKGDEDEELFSPGFSLAPCATSCP